MKRAGCVFGDDKTGGGDVADVAADADVANVGVWYAREGGRPLIIAHRGGAGIFPENTFAAMRKAALLGVDVLDMDARLSKDGVLVAFHDKTLNRTTNGSGEVADYRADELAMLNAAAHFVSPDGNKHRTEPIPRIADILRAFASGNLLFVIEIKNRDKQGKLAAQKLADIVNSLNLQKRVIVGSFDGAPLATYRKALTNAATSASRYEAAGIILSGGLYAPPLAALQIPPSFAGLELASRESIGKFRARGYAVHYWTINDAGQMAQLVANGADGIFSDYPNILREVLADGGFALPPPVMP